MVELYDNLENVKIKITQDIMIREEQIKQQADKYNSEDFGEDITSIISERIAFIEGAKWADANPNKKLVYTKQELLDMGFGFDLNGNIRTPNECYESSIKYTEYRKQKLIDKACKILKSIIDEDVFVKCDNVIKIMNTDEFSEYFRKAIEE